MTDKAFLKYFNEFKSHPLVAFFLAQINAKSEGKVIADVWKDFIRNTDETTDMAILNVQLVNWGLISKVDATLRGEALLESILSTQAKPHFERALDVVGMHKNIEFPEALEKVLISKGILPDISGERSAVEHGGVALPVDLQYCETGRMTYQIIRRLPNTLAIIPPEFVAKNFGPKFSDDQIVHNFKVGMNTLFGKRDPRTVANDEETSEVLAHMRRHLYHPGVDTDLRMPLMPPNTTPLKGQATDEPQTELRFSEVTPNQLSAVNNVTREVLNRGYQILPCRKQNRRSKVVECFFPAYTTAMKKDVPGGKTPGVHTYSEGINLAADFEDYPEDHTYQVCLVEFLRKAYAHLSEKEEYKTAKAEILKTIKPPPVKKPGPVRKKAPAKKKAVAEKVIKPIPMPETVQYVLEE